MSGNDDALDEENSVLPRALLEPVRRHVQAYSRRLDAHG